MEQKPHHHSIRLVSVPINDMKSVKQGLTPPSQHLDHLLHGLDALEHVLHAHGLRHQLLSAARAHGNHQRLCKLDRRSLPAAAGQDPRHLGPAAGLRTGRLVLGHRPSHDGRLPKRRDVCRGTGLLLDRVRSVLPFTCQSRRTICNKSQG